MHHRKKAIPYTALTKTSEIGMDKQTNSTIVAQQLKTFALVLMWPAPTCFTQMQPRLDLPPSKKANPDLQCNQYAATEIQYMATYLNYEAIL